MVSTAPKLLKASFRPTHWTVQFERALGAKQRQLRRTKHAAANDLGAPGSARQGRNLRQGRGLDPRVHEIARGLGRRVDDLSHATQAAADGRRRDVPGVARLAPFDAVASHPRPGEESNHRLPAQPGGETPRLDIDDAQHTPANVRAQEFGGRRLEDALWLQGWCARKAI